jgi:hypothetical protein
MNLVSLAQKWLKAGFSVLPTDKNKLPAFNKLPTKDGKASWETLKTKPYSLEEVEAVFRDCEAIAVICGTAGLFLFDFDQDKKGRAKEPYDLSGDYMTPWVNEAMNLNISPVLQTTPSGGFHFPVVCPKPLGNLHLASVEAKDGKAHAVIETRGNGGYFLIYDDTLDPMSIPNVSEKQFDRLIETAMDLNRYELSEADKTKAIKSQKASQKASATTKGLVGWFNEQNTVRGILERNGYKQIRNKYLSPHSSSGNAGVVIFEDSNGLELCYSHHNEALGDGHAHDAFDTFKMLEHGGDFEGAISAVRKKKGGDNFDFTKAPILPTKPVIDLTNRLHAEGLEQKKLEEQEEKQQAAFTEDDFQVIKWSQRPKPKPIQWLVKHLLQDNAENLIGGEPGVGKSWIVTELLTCVATGTRFLGRDTTKGNSLFINFDDNEESNPRNFAERSARGKEYDFNDLDITYWQPNPNKAFPSFGLITPEIFEGLKGMVQKLNPRLIVVDAFASAFPALDGNKGPDCIVAFEALRQLRRESKEDCTVVLIDHTPKPAVGESKRRGVSGSQQKHGRPRTVHIVRRVERSEVGGDDVLEWEVFKANAAPFQEPFGIQREMNELMNWSSLEVRDLPDDKKAPQQSRCVRAAIMTIQNAGGRQVGRADLIRAVIEITNAGKATVERALNSSEFVDNQLIQAKKGPGHNTPVVYSWRGESIEFKKGYELLRELVSTAQWQAGNIELLQDYFRKADGGDAQAREAIYAYLDEPQVQKYLRIDDELYN